MQGSQSLQAILWHGDCTACTRFCRVQSRRYICLLHILHKRTLEKGRGAKWWIDVVCLFTNIIAGRRRVSAEPILVCVIMACTRIRMKCTIHVPSSAPSAENIAFTCRHKTMKGYDMTLFTMPLLRCRKAYVTCVTSYCAVSVCSQSHVHYATSVSKKCHSRKLPLRPSHLRSSTHNRAACCVNVCPNTSGSTPPTRFGEYWHTATELTEPCRQHALCTGPHSGRRHLSTRDVTFGTQTYVCLECAR